MRYEPYDRRTPDSQYRDLLARVLEHGEKTPTRQGPPALTLLQQTMRFDLANGFPVITDRSIASFWRKPIGELCAFINGATTLDELRAFGCDWWDDWATEEKTAKRGLPPGDIGPGSYGGAFHDFPTSEGPAFDQFQHLVEQITELPADRTHFVSPWIPQYQVRGHGKTPRTTIAPCHGWVHVRILNDRLHLHMFQRSGDVPVGVPSNMVQYAALALMLEQLTGFAAAAATTTRSPTPTSTPTRSTRCSACSTGSPAACRRCSSPRRAGRSPTSMPSGPSTSSSPTTTPTPGLRIPVSP